MGVAVQPVQTTAQTRAAVCAPGPIMDAFCQYQMPSLAQVPTWAVHINFGHRQPVAAGRS